MVYLKQFILFIWACPFMWAVGDVFDKLCVIFPNLIFKIVTLIICGLLGYYTGSHLYDYMEEN